MSVVDWDAVWWEFQDELPFGDATSEQPRTPTGMDQPARNASTVEPTHQVICGDNLAVLRDLAVTHTGQVDVIYIDPPYNTGNTTWIYSDSRTTTDWTTFMRARLEAARELLSDTGIICVAIGDGAHHRIRCLLDDVFGADTFLANIIWQGQPAGGTATSAGVDYMVVHSRRRGHRPEWHEPKPGVAEALSKAAEFWKAAGEDRDSAEAMMRRWWNHDGRHHPRGLRDYTRLSDTGRLYRPGPLAAPDKPEKRSHRPLTHPLTGGACPVPSMGWRVSDATMDELLAADRIEFGPDQTVIPTRRYFLDEQDQQRPGQVFYQPRRSNHVDNLLGDRRFPYPKDHTVLMRWLRMWTPPGGVVLDFFAGSGSTLEAVLRLNADDGAARECILVTNNELAGDTQRRLTAAGYRPGDAEWEQFGVFEHVTKPRIYAVLTGQRPDGSATGLTPVPGRVVYVTSPAAAAVAA